MKKFLPILFAALLALGSTAMAQDVLGKGGKGGGGKGGGGTTGGTTGGSGGGGGRSTPPPPPKRNGGSTTGGSGGGISNGGSRGTTNPPSRDRDSRDTSPVRSTNSDPLSRRSSGTGRSGAVNYGSRSNVNSSGRSNSTYQIPPPPRVSSDSRNTREAWGEAGNIQRNASRYRQGYYHYSDRWVDDYFHYPFYSFSYNNNCAPSPWYHYPHLPAYVSVVRIQIGDFGFEWQQGSRYDWRYDKYRDNGWGFNSNNNSERELNYAVDDIYDAFRRSSMRTMAGLIPSNGWINVEVDRYAKYRLRSDDFYDLMQDVVEGTQTTNYRIREVRRWRGGATVVADHEYRDPWGRRRNSRHYFGLQEGRRGYEIVSFRSDD